MVREEIIYRYFPALSDVQKEQFRLIGDLYPDWNAKVNVISRKDIDNLYTNHVLHSLAIAKFLHPVEDSAILDIGTGGGFPGIPLAIMFPQCRFHLIDRIGKKIKVAQAVADAIGLKNVTFQHGDSGECHDKFDFIVSRAVMKFDGLVPLVRKNIAVKQRNGMPNGLICLKGGDVDDECRKVNGKPYIEYLSCYFSEPFFETKKLIYLPM